MSARFLAVVSIQSSLPGGPHTTGDTHPMPRLIGPDKGAIEVGVGDSVVRRQKDGTFHVGPHTAALMRKTGDFTVAGTKINGRGFVCRSCKFVALLSDHCGRCGGAELDPE